MSDNIETVSTPTSQHDQQLLEELLTNQRLIKHPTFGTVKLQRPTPRKERLIAEVRQKSRAADMQARTQEGAYAVLSISQLEKEAIERGDWSIEKKERMETLKRLAAAYMVTLEGLAYESVEDMLIKYQQTVNALVVSYADNADAVLAIQRYFDLESEPTLEDEKIIRDSSPGTEADEHKIDAETYRAQLKMMGKLVDTTNELKETEKEYTRLFQDSLESREERVETLAHIYYCSTKPDGSPLWPTFEDIWDQNPYDISLLRQELYYFNAMIHDDFRKMMDKHGFTVRAPEEIFDVQSED